MSNSTPKSVWSLVVTSADRLALKTTRLCRAAFQISDGSGVMVCVGENENSTVIFEIDILTWPSGVYTIQVADELGQETLHFVKT